MKKILVIEDNAEVLENICEILELSGYAVIPAENGKSGVKKAINDDPDLILCDVMMPELDGFGVLQILNNNAKTYSIPFIFLTAKAEKEDFRKGMTLGADDYITKPFDDTDLLQTIARRLEKSERIRSLYDKSDEGLTRFFSQAKAQKEFEKLSSEREVRKMNAKDLIYEEGQYPRYLFYIVKGSVKCYKVNEFGKELITHIHHAGDFVGYYPLIKDAPYADNCMSISDSEIRLIPKNDFSMLLFNNRDFAAQFIKLIADQAIETEQQLIELAYSSVRKKVANALLTFAKKENEGRGGETFSASRDDLASLAGTAKETLIRTISDFKSEKLIEIDGNAIRILDKDKLESMPQ